jgi:hypothetical protein
MKLSIGSRNLDRCQVCLIKPGAVAIALVGQPIRIIDFLSDEPQTAVLKLDLKEGEYISYLTFSESFQALTGKSYQSFEF